MTDREKCVIMLFRRYKAAATPYDRWKAVCTMIQALKAAEEGGIPAPALSVQVKSGN